MSTSKKTHYEVTYTTSVAPFAEVTETAEGAVAGNRLFKARRKQWCYVTLYRVEITRTKIRQAKYDR